MLAETSANKFHTKGLRWAYSKLEIILQFIENVFSG